MKTQKLLFVGLFVLMGNALMAQCRDKPIPLMIVTSGKAQSRFTELKNRMKYFKMDNVIYPVKKFTRLLDLIMAKPKYNGVRIYIGNKNKNPQNFDTSITFIFVPTEKVDTVTYHDSVDSIYYAWDNTDFIPKTFKEAKDLVNNYENSDLKKELNKIKHQDIVGGILQPPAMLTYSDTRCMLYKSTCELEQLKDEFECQNKSGKIDGIRIDFSTYGTSNYGLGNDVPEYHNRLIFHFEMMNAKKVFAIDKDDLINYNYRIAHNPQNCEIAKILPGPEGGFDTGDPCPPGGGCEGESL